eukprot:152208-Pyramimonas_sp.AAC.1
MSPLKHACCYYLWLPWLTGFPFPVSPPCQALGIPVIHTYNLTAPLHDFHRNNGKGHECSKTKGVA